MAQASRVCHLPNQVHLWTSLQGQDPHCGTQIVKKVLSDETIFNWTLYLLILDEANACKYLEKRLICICLHLLILVSLSFLGVYGLPIFLKQF